MSEQIKSGRIILLPNIKYLKINWVASIFYIVLVLNFCLSGVLTGITGQLFRLGIVSVVLIFPLLFHKLVIDPVVITFIALVGVICLSALYNGSSGTELYQFLRHVIFSFSMYYVARIYIKAERAVPVMRFLYRIASIQLPVVLFQRIFYERLPANWTQYSVKADFDFGTFPVNYDPALAFTLVLLIAFLLFNPKSRLIIRNRWLTIAWLTITIFFVNSQICHIIIVLIWIVYLFLHVNIKKIIIAVALFMLVSSLVYMSSSHLGATTAVITLERLVRDWQEPDQEVFTSGGYSRKAAILYYLNEPLKIIGDGPAKYFDKETGTHFLGNRGHIFTFYSEVGIVGLFFSYLVFFFIAIVLRTKAFVLGYSISFFRFMAFFSLVLLSLVSNITLTPVVLAYACIVISDYELYRVSE